MYAEGRVLGLSGKRGNENFLPEEIGQRLFRRRRLHHAELIS